ncbi:leucine-rich repeat domain-containing protein [Mangrovimonas spongiae]|uniref:T9SS C-terminal target domain-containing protein n=1 Tax=Mangrovimonas spongiae TaxID=2494697 RepID=A0A3R9PJJ3_9FLAO|nr:leucine-rich repeat domain-containing protein [Mangrovimonas spongiae]RSK39663.1 T9SS C-terminal target domain-containing protein [Mangrovimonas spongiae]
MKKNLLSLLTLFMVAIGYSQTFTATDSYGNILQYTVTSANTVTAVSGGTLNNINVDIPVTVSNAGTTYNVTAIGDHFFQGAASLSSVSIPNAVTSIGKQAFGNTNLSSVVLPSSLITIDEYAFQYCQLQGITIPNNVTSIGIGAFRGNYSLSTVTTLATTPPIIITEANNNDSFALYGDRSNIDLYIPAGTTAAYVTDAGALWTGFNTVTENLNVGDTYVNNYITYEVTSVANSTVKAVDYNTAGGTVVNIPATIPNGLITYSVTEIGDFAFDYKNLTDVTLPNSIVNIGENAFFNNDLSSVIIPDSVITIDDIAFAQNNNMTNLVLGNNVTSIGDAAFRFNALNNITIPASVTNIGVVAFGGMGGTNAITDVYCQGMVPPTIATSSAPNSDTFNQDRSTIHLHIPGGTMGAYVTDAGALWTGFNPVTEDALSVDEFQLKNAVKVITTAESIEVETSNNIQLESYSMYTISGQKIKTGSESEIATGSMASGIYILKLDFDRGMISKKVLIK